MNTALKKIFVLTLRSKSKISAKQNFVFILIFILYIFFNICINIFKLAKSLILAAAKYFYEHEVTSFLVLEANDYIGGQMKNQMFGNASVTLGASWIHLPETNHSLHRIAKKYNMDWRFNALNDTTVR